MKTAIYTRVSTKDQELGLESQKRSISLFLESKGIYDPMEYIDHGLSAKDTDRPQFKAMLNDAKLGKVQLLVVWKLDRLSRKLSDLLEVIRALDGYGTKLISLHENIDMTTSHGVAMIQMIGVFAELERNMCSERTKAALAVLKANGEKLGRPVTIGYEIKSKIIELRNKNISMGLIAKELKISSSTVFKVIKENL